MEVTNMGFENLELITLHQYWWIIISLLGGLFVFIMFVQGGQTLIDKLSENEIEKINSSNLSSNFPIEEIFIKPKRSDIYNVKLELLWKEQL